MSNSRSLRRLAIFLGTAASVAALPAQEKRAPQEVTATIDGVVVSWVNNYTPGAATPAAALTTAPAVPAPSGQDYITATINGQVVSWVNDYTPGAAAATTPAPAPAPTSAPAAPAGSSPIWVTATYDGATFSFIYTYVPVTTPAPAPPASTTTPILTQFPTPAPTLTPGEQCEDVHIFIAKGNNEPYPGRQGVLVDAICADLPSSVSCGYENIMYDNDLSDNYCTSVSQGDVNGKEQMTQYAANCPNAKLVLSGYSQGSNIVGDILGGGGGPFGHPQACTIDEFTGINPYTSPGNQRKYLPHLTPFTSHLSNNMLTLPSYSRRRPPIRQQPPRRQSSLQRPQWLCLRHGQPALPDPQLSPEHEPLLRHHPRLLR